MDQHAEGPAGVDVAYGVFTPEEYAALEAVPFLPEWNTPTIPFAEDGSGQNNTSTVTVVLDFKTVAEGITTDVFGNDVGDFDVTSFGFAASQFDQVVAAIAAEVDQDYFSELVGTVAGPAGRDLKIDFVVGDFGTPPPGPTEYYYVQIGSGIAGPHTGAGTLGVAATSAIRTETGVADQFGLAGVAFVSSIFTNNIRGLGGLSPSNALSSGNLTYTTYAVAGTLAHEIGHLLSLSHINKAGSTQPTPGVAPLMGTGAIDLPNQDRITDRQFSLSGVDGQNGNAPRQHVQQLVNALGLDSSNKLYINEILVDPPSTDGLKEYIELRGAVGQSLSGLYLLFLESDGDSTLGTIDTAINLSAASLGANGHLVIRDPASSYVVDPAANTLNMAGLDIENAAYTALIVDIGTGSAPTVNQDLDVGNNGLDTLPAGWTILDGVAALNGDANDRAYSSIVFSSDADGATQSGATFINTGFGTNNVSHLMRVGNSTADAVTDWAAFKLAASSNAPNYQVELSSQASFLAGSIVTNHVGSSNPSSSVTVVRDDGDAGFTTTGPWNPYTSGGRGGDLRYLNPASPAGTATWAFNGLQSGQYRVSATWPTDLGAAAATNAPF
ncbi:MAG TPA: hypothetical protein VM165_13770, partial [Planctomycetaceae bacterium]|nr:hypothetical protein [Planctomycetaceae bacterium]